MPKNNKQRKNRIKTVLAVLLVICIGAAIGIVFTPIFDVQEVYCEGNSRISTETLTEAAQIGMGENIIFQSLSRIEKVIKEIPEIEEVTIKRIFPNKIKIQVKERVPAGYIVTENKCTAIDLERRVLNISEGEEAEDIIEYLTPSKIEGRPEEKADEKNPENENKGEEKAEEKDTQDTSAEDDGEQGEDENNPDGEELAEELKTVNIPYEVPLITGVEIRSADIGKEIQSKEEGKLDKVMSMLTALEKAGLLKRTTYIDAANINDVILVIEKRLEVQIGNLDNIDYRCAFLAKIINEKLSATEHAVLDYRNDDIYVRQPDDGKERIVPKPTPTPEPSDEPEEDEEEESESHESSASAAPSAGRLEE